jgi:hypothetical protein
VIGGILRLIWFVQKLASDWGHFVTVILFVQKLASDWGHFVTDFVCAEVGE